MKKHCTLLTIAIFILFLNVTSFSQSNPRMENPDYAVTNFFDDFNASFRNNWEPFDNSLFSSSKTPNLLIWVDSTATIYQNSGDLNLTAIKDVGYTTKDWYGNPITANFISGQIRSKERFLYGVFECSATFGYKQGSFPAFWLFFDSICVDGY